MILLKGNIKKIQREKNFFLVIYNSCALVRATWYGTIVQTTHTMSVSFGNKTMIENFSKSLASTVFHISMHILFVKQIFRRKLCRSAFLH